MVTLHELVMRSLMRELRCIVVMTVALHISHSHPYDIMLMKTVFRRHVRKQQCIKEICYLLKGSVSVHHHTLSIMSGFTDQCFYNSRVAGVSLLGEETYGLL